MMKHKWLLIDGDFLLTYFWFRGPEVVQQYWMELAALVGYFNIDKVAIAWDSSSKDRRRAHLPDYKCNRIVTPEWREKKPQLKEELLQSLKVLPIRVGHINGLEADDLVWLWRQDRRSIVVSGDKDLWQCLGEHTEIWSPRKHQLVTMAEVQREFGGDTTAMTIQRCLIGDKSDGIKGVDGIGPQRAKVLWTKWSDVLAPLVLQNEVVPAVAGINDRWLDRVIQEKETLQVNWKVMKIGELLTKDDKEESEQFLKQDVKLLDADAARFYVAQKGWFTILREWPRIIQALQRLS